MTVDNQRINAREENVLRRKERMVHDANDIAKEEMRKKRCETRDDLTTVDMLRPSVSIPRLRRTSTLPPPPSGCAGQ